MGDPINETFAPWLKSELDTRFPGRPVRYVVYSHSHFDHAAGGAAFADTATFVAHENMLRNMDKFGGVIFSQAVLLKLVDKGLSREEAYRIVQSNAMKASTHSARNQFVCQYAGAMEKSSVA